MPRMLQKFKELLRTGFASYLVYPVSKKTKLAIEGSRFLNKSTLLTVFRVYRLLLCYHMSRMKGVIMQLVIVVNNFY